MADIKDLTNWVRQATSPILDGNFPSSLRDVFFFGYDQVSISSITINSIWQADNDNQAPYALCCSARDVSATGSRLLSTKSIDPYLHLEYRWEVTNNDDSAVEDLEGITDPRDGSAVNPYTDQISPEATFMLRKAGTYKVKLTVRGMSSIYGEVIEETLTDTVTVIEPVIDHVWIDGLNGNDSNDGLDPWGFALTTATYTESTGELTQSGAFSSYVHDSTSNETDRDNYIYVTKSGVTGLYRIASKTSNDTIVLEQKLGSDQTNVTSSDGPKQTFNGTISQGNRYHLNGNSSYTITTQIDTNGFTADFGIFGYNGTPTLIADGVIGYISDSFYNTSDVMPDRTDYSNIIFDGDDSAGTLGFANRNTTDSSTALFQVDRVSSIKNSTANGVLLDNDYTYPKKLHIIMNRLEVDNRYLSGGKAASAIGLFTATANGAVTRAIGLDIKNDADASSDHYWYPSGDLDNFHCGYSNFDEGSGSNYGLNFTTHNAAGNSVSTYLSVNNNNFGPTMDWGYDNTGSADVTQEFFEKFVSINNKCAAINGLTLSYSMRTSLQGYNQDFGSAQYSASYQQGDSVHDYTNFDSVIIGSESYGRIYAIYTEGGNVELSNNTGYYTFDGTILHYDPADLIGTNVFAAKDNNFYAPSKSNSNIFLEDSIEIDLAAFNTSVGFTNTSTDPSWPDPSNGDFGGLPTGIAVEIQA